MAGGGVRRDMPNIISPFENEDWTLTGGGGAYVSTPTHRGSTTALKLRHNTVGINTTAQSPDMVVNAGSSYDIEFWLQWTDVQHEQFTMLLQHYPSGTSMSRTNIALIESTDYAKDVWHLFKYTVTAGSTTDALYFATQLSGNSFAGTINWFCDNVVYTGDAVAVKLAERAIGALDTLLKANLGTELSAIDSDRGDGITMAVPASGDYHHFRKEVVAGDVTISIFEDAFTFLNPYTDAAAQRAVYELPITIRVTWFNRDGDAFADVETRSRRYLTGIFNVINKNDSLGDSDDATQSIVATDCSGTVGLDERNYLKGQAELRCLVRCEETQA